MNGFDLPPTYVTYGLRTPLIRSLTFWAAADFTRLLLVPKRIRPRNAVTMANKGKLTDSGAARLKKSALKKYGQADCKTELWLHKLPQLVVVVELNPPSKGEPRRRPQMAHWQAGKRERPDSTNGPLHVLEFEPSPMGSYEPIKHSAYFMIYR